MKWCKLGDVVERIERTNADGKYGEEDVRGVSNTKLIQKTKASMAGRDFKPFLVINPKEFVFNRRTTRNGDRLGLGFNRDTRPYIFTEDYVAFRVKDEKQFLPEYLYMFFLRDEFDRYVRWDSWGSATEFFNWENMQLVSVPLPTLAEQREAVAAWQGLRKLKTENEQLAEPLMALCRSFLQGCKAQYEHIEIGPYLIPHDVRNSDLAIKLSQGVANTKEFQTPKQVAANSRGDKIVRTGQFAYNRATTRNGEKISIAYRRGPDCTVSGAYQVFSIANESVISPEFLMLWFSRPEFDRYARYMSKGSAHEFFEFADMCRVKVPLPPVEVQQSIVDIYRAAAEAKRIAAEADDLSRKICPALIQKVVAGARPGEAGLRTTPTGRRRG